MASSDEGRLQTAAEATLVPARQAGPSPCPLRIAGGHLPQRPDPPGSSLPRAACLSGVSTWKTALPRPIVDATIRACLVHIYPAGPGLGARFPLGDVPLDVGRGAACDIRIDDGSVSRHHARIVPEADGYSVLDLGSTNGTFINDQPVVAHRLRDGDYLRIGNCICRFLAGGNVEADYYEEIYRLTIIDALTEVHNKRYLLEFLERELSRSARYRRPLALLLFDIDRFKTVNDELGHLGGDYTLRELASCVRTVVRKEDLFARYGGEEFVIGLVETTRDGAVILAERLRMLVEQHTFRYENHAYQVTVSLGVAATSGEEFLTPDELIRRADAKLYQAKREGRNRLMA
jgi:diguanylate cyclase (GGDEF)-like protein